MIDINKVFHYGYFYLRNACDAQDVLVRCNLIIIVKTKKILIIEVVLAARNNNNISNNITTQNKIITSKIEKIIGKTFKRSFIFLYMRYHMLWNGHIAQILDTIHLVISCNWIHGRFRFYLEAVLLQKLTFLLKSSISGEKQLYKCYYLIL